MTTGLKGSVADSLLDALGRATNYTAPVAFYVKLHLGDPGAAGTANPAANTTREAATFSASSGGSMTTSVDITWSSVSNSETYSHVSFWDASSSGNFIGSDALDSSRAVVAGDDFTIPSGDLTLTLSPIAA